MIKGTLEKIEKLIKDKEYQLPQLMMKLLSFLMHFAKKIEIKNSQYVALDIFADAYKLFKNFLVEQPFKLKKISAHQLNALIGTNHCLSEIQNLRDRFLKELAGFTPNDPIGRKTISELMDLKWAKKCCGPLSVAESNKAQLEQKKGKNKIMSEFAMLFWYGSLQGQYLIHINLFAQKLLDFLLQFLAPFSFLDKNGLFCLKELADPDHRYYLTASSCEDLFLRIRTPEVIERLWQNSQEKVSNEPFISQSSMMIRVSTKDFAIDQIVGVTGQKLIMPGGEEKDVKLSPAVLLGSAADCDIVLKNKYISRKQMAIIEDLKTGKMKESDKYNFSLVCLSQTNFTIISYPHETKAYVGLIFYGQNVKYQVIKYEKLQLPQFAEDGDDDHTLSILPSEKDKHSQSIYQMLTLLILSGEDKEEEVTISIQSQSTKNEVEKKHNSILKQVLIVQQQIFLKPETKILCKTSNDILQGKISRKIRLRKGLKIFVEDYVLNIE